MSALLDLSGVSVRRSGRLVLDRVDLRLDSGERLALAGANGAGKTTLLRAIVGLEAVETGKILAFDRPRRDDGDFRDLRQRVGFLFQDSDDQLFAPTVIEDVAFGPLNLGFTPAQAVERAKAVLADLDLLSLERRVTHHLSGGEKRLVALAGVLAMDPDVLLLDEPTNALDEAHLARLTAILAELPVTMILVSHDAHFLATLSTRAVLLEDGRLKPAVAHRHQHRHDHVHFHPVDEN
ncbi:cobalt ABC transporter ATP-binding protein [Pleomorphomonas diazotrophica]|uniref:Cobalt ABC transporter ATP-binding protein n=1 Tax=Pleomorphomonas diazotrophica TaxID=1166257 RepID=A0A1I4WJW8_9HYPH|nr:ABC transporter ATP-binding protein [Pleomorphomonas diazotrophica]PKR91034.1 cobalt ABC transporter ATP-binding protein [Pleomorphomonas diazotrophica]SFN14008.1 cobalt/nickel transport system ATP-binding protein [Pleomorphomonas diazotrophica]